MRSYCKSIKSALEAISNRVFKPIATYTISDPELIKFHLNANEQIGVGVSAVAVTPTGSCVLLCILYDVSGSTA